MPIQNYLGYQLGRFISQKAIIPAGQMAVGGLARGAAGLGKAGVRTAQNVNWQRGWQNAGSQSRYLWGNRKEIAQRIGRGSKAAYGATIGKEVKFWKGAGRVASKVPLISMAMVGYSVSQGKNAAESVLRGGAEVGALTAAGMGASVGAGIGAGIGTALLPGVGTVIGKLIGGFVGWGVSYTGTKALTDLGFKDKQAPKFEDVYMNRRALTMRQASQMHLAKSSRAAFGNEASSMHLR